VTAFIYLFFKQLLVFFKDCIKLCLS